MKRLLAALLVFLLLPLGVPALASEKTVVNNTFATGLPIVQEEITLRVVHGRHTFVTKPYNDLLLTQMVYEDTGIRLDFENVEGGEKPNLMIASGDMPDLFSAGTAPDPVGNGALGLYRPVQDDIADWSPIISNFLAENPNVKSMATAPDGNMYGYFHYYDTGLNSVSPSILINEAWLDKVGMDKPDTIDELVEVLRAFKASGDLDGDGQGQIWPFGFAQNGFAATMEAIMPAFGLKTGKTLYVEDDGTVQFAYAQEGFKDLVVWLRGLVEEGLLDPETFTHDFASYTAKIAQYNYGVCFLWAPYSAFGVGNPNDMGYLPPLVGPNGDVGYSWGGTAPVVNSTVVTSACKYPEAVARLMDYISDVSLERGVYVADGLLGINVLPGEDGLLRVQSPAPSYEYWPGHSGLAILVTKDHVKDWGLDTGIYVDRKIKVDLYLETAEKTLANEYPTILATAEETQEMSTIITDIDNFVKSSYVEWILKGGVEESWDRYLAQLEDMGLSRYIEIRQQMYDRYSAQ